MDHSVEAGGAELALARVLENEERGWIADLAIPCADSDGAFAGIDSVGSARIIRVGAPQAPASSSGPVMRAIRVFAAALRQARALRATVAVDEYDVIHANSSRSALYTALALIGTKVPLVVHLRDQVTAEALGAVGLLAFRAVVMRRAHFLIANSQATASTVVGWAGRDRRVTVIPSPIGIRVADEVRESSNELLTIGMVARLSKWKGQELLLEAFRRSGLDKRAKLVFYGDAAFGEDQYARRLFALVGELRLENVEFAGFVSDIEAAIDSLDICVQYSERPEPLGQNILQYLARGKPVIAAAEGGPVEWIVNDVTGLLIEPRNINALAEALTRMSHDAQLRQRLSEAAITVSSSLPTAASVSSEMAQVFRSAIRVERN